MTFGVKPTFNVLSLPKATYEGGVISLVMAYLLSLYTPLYTGLDNEINIQKTIQLVKAQRLGMVQTEVRVTFMWKWFLERKAN